MKKNRKAQRSSPPSRGALVRRSSVVPILCVCATLVIVAVSAVLWGHEVPELEQRGGVWRQLGSLVNVLILAVEFVLFLSPGSLLLLLFRNRRVPPVHILMACITVSALIGYAAFWAYFLDHRFGSCLSIVVALAGLVGLVWRWRAPSSSCD